MARENYIRETRTLDVTLWHQPPNRELLLMSIPRGQVKGRKRQNSRSLSLNYWSIRHLWFWFHMGVVRFLPVWWHKERRYKSSIPLFPPKTCINQRKKNLWISRTIFLNIQHKANNNTFENDKLISKSWTLFWNPIHFLCSSRYSSSRLTNSYPLLS